ncbi:hypothetical protein SAE01_09310 [Segetibacter aerophilus]|uniref:Outer membrane protein beta-barrel domain-containing protein n=1 Tax=Segetibacter aerophilus TaxID=670293 RepID=A0A512B8Z4_9BACT|nr:hypothetical protein SAE01_09310 [Segetibacter aerophilus]
MKVKNIVLVAISTLIVTVSYSQAKDLKQQKKAEKREQINRMISQEEEGAIIFQKQTVFGVKLNTDGYGMFLEMGRMKTARKANLYSLEIGERKHSKEEKLSTITGTYLSNPYIYGKINNFYYAKLGYAQQRLIGNKGNKNGVAVSAIYGGGLSAGLLKPYYLKVAGRQGNSTTDVKYNNNDSIFLDNPGYVLGSSGFSKGFGEIKFTPGLYAKTALRFDYGRYNELVSAIEVGINLEFYSKKMRWMLEQKQKQMFFQAYAAIEFGKRK